MKREAKTFALDGLLMACTFYLSIWLYEGSNYLVLSLEGTKPYLTVEGVIPTSVVAVSYTQQSTAALKILQTGICVCAVLALLTLARKSRLTGTKVTLAVMIGAYVASFPWELLALPGPVPGAMLQVIYLLATASGGLAITLACSNFIGLGPDPRRFRVLE